jgi:surface antigen
MSLLFFFDFCFLSYLIVFLKKVLAMNKKFLVLCMLSLFSFSQFSYAECTPKEGDNIFGTLVGAALGGLVGSQIGGGTGNKIAIGAGVLAGGYFGNKVSKSLSCADQEKHYSTTQSALESQKSGETSTWINPDTGHKGEVTPTRTYQSTKGIPCREFTQTIYVEGEHEKVEGKACRTPDGNWEVVT